MGYPISLWYWVVLYKETTGRDRQNESKQKSITTSEGSFLTLS